MGKIPKITRALLSRLKDKASSSDCIYRISAVAFDRKGNVLGHASNSHSDWDVLEKEKEGRSGTAKHAERILMKRYKGLVKTIVICRVGQGGELRQIDSCQTCRKVAKKYGVRIMSVCPGNK